MPVTRKQLAASILFLLLNTSMISAQKVTVAVVDLEGIGISQVEAVALSNRLRNELFRLGIFKVVDRGLMQNILEEQNLQQTGCTSNECLVELGRLLGVQQMIGGSISKIENMFSVSTRVVDVETGEVISVSDYDREAGLSEILTNGMKEVAQSLSGSADEPVANLVEREESKPVVRSPDQSLKRFALAYGLLSYKEFWDEDQSREGSFLLLSFRTRRAFGSRFPIRPVLTTYFDLDTDNLFMYLLEGSYSFERRILRYTVLLGGGLVPGNSHLSGGSFSFQIELMRGLPLMIEWRSIEGYLTTLGIGFGL